MVTIEKNLIMKSLIEQGSKLSINSRLQEKSDFLVFEKIENNSLNNSMKLFLPIVLSSNKSLDYTALSKKCLKCMTRMIRGW